MSVSATGQKPAFYVVGKVEFQGKTSYSAAAMERVAGLKVGAPLTNADLEAAAGRLIATGAFGDVLATLDGPVKSVNVVFKVTPTDDAHMLRVSFDNFIWYSQEELVEGVKQRVPLFDGRVPEGGSIQEAVQDALQAMVVAKELDATVASQLVAPSPGQPLRLAEYHVVKPEIRVHAVRITGVPTAFDQDTDKTVQSLLGEEYNDGLVGGLSERILSDYRDAGYEEAVLKGLKCKVASSTATKVEVDVAATLSTGELYRVSKIDWAGSPQMSREAFAAACKLHPGNVASEQILRKALEALDDAYRNQGFVDVAIHADSQLDKSKHTVAFRVTAVPGVQYRLGKMKVDGLTALHQKEFDRGWRLHSGDLYNAGYVKSFLTNNAALTSLAKYRAKYYVTEDSDAGRLDLHITFVKDETRLLH